MTYFAHALDNEIALVTGSTRGIGRAIALTLAKAGARVVATATSDAGVATIEQYFAEAGLAERCLPIRLNVCDKTECETVQDLIQKQWGTISILVNNAGITRDQLAMRMKEDEWDDVIATNLTAVGRWSRMVLRGMMKAKTGRIITISSVVGASGNAGQMNYAAAKAGVMGMSRALAREVGSRNITVNSVAPGFIDTDMTHGLAEEQKAALLQQIPLGRLGSADEIAQAVLFLASPAAAYITGTTLHVNGGMFMN